MGGEIETDGLFENLSSNDYQLVVTDSEGCTTDTLFNIDQPEEIILLGPNEIWLSNLQDTVISLETNLDVQFIDTIIWNPSQDCIDCFTINVPGSEEDQVYQVTLVDINGCLVTKEIEIKILDDKLVYLPNIFAPSSDINGVFFPQSGNDKIFIKELRIFDRWGNQVFSNYEFHPNAPEDGWNGIFKNKEAITGVYVYLMKFSNDGEECVMKGDVTLLR